MSADPLTDPGLSRLARCFEEFHRTNPHVYRMLVRLAKQWADRHPRRKASIALMVEVARWETMMGPTYDAHSEFKIANAYRAFYSRLIMHHHPELEGLFGTAESEADAWMALRLAELEAS